MKPLPTVMIQGVVETLRTGIKPGVTSDWENTEWTTAVLHQLSVIGNNFGFVVKTTGNPEGSDGPEWLYDQTWMYHNSGDRSKYGWSISLVAECEWGNLDEIQYDFDKLLQSRADVRVMIFDAALGARMSSKSVALELCDWVSLFQGSKSNDIYLVIAYEHVKAPWNWRFFTILSNGFGKPATLQDITS